MLAKYTKILFLLLLLFISKSFIYAQNNLRFSEGWGIGANIGLNYFFGDISDDKGRIWNNTPLSSFYYTDKNLMASFSLSKSINRFWGIRGHISYGKLSGSDEKTLMYFKGNVYSMDLDVSFQYLDYFLKRPESSKFKYYAFAGLGLCSFNAIARDVTSNTFLYARGYDRNGNTTNLNTESKLKLGLGIAYQLDKKWIFNFETSLHYLNTDYLDAYKSTSSKLEGYGFMSLGVIYKFNWDFNFSSKTNTVNSLWEKSRGNNDRSYNSGLKNKKKRKLYNKWKK
ncbi:MAG: hypothetical protein HXX18_13850 [Bacteroidetes bacterium]|nr:hypothetical protein [Bacteroidota bacterium]